ncbi:MAG: septal ring lytic transglycosylase RlpA family protein [Nitrospinae bacterium]|nr:septal ring lytic transglycosylase RlpA family protein [Nitrospinota bacterium]
MKPGRKVFVILLCAVLAAASGCSAVKTTYRVAKGTAIGAVWVIIGAYELTAGATRLVYSVGKFTFEVVRAPIEWALMNEDIETIDGLPVKEAIKQGRVKNSPYTVKGRAYYPMTVAQAQDYEETGIASWYGYETLRQPGGRMTANGEAFDPRGLTAAHKYLPLPTNVEVTNLANGKTIVVRVNDRGPFPSDHNPSSGQRIIDLSMGAAKELGFYEKGTALVRVRALRLEEVG